ncbi:DUF5803 family protein [Halocalculus aciditolerans]|uniref:Lipoprotein n=1 Tax=Halocalculus aciditolerans TaxID=1383812 RepID=A0A830FBY0_9EURY|nr:DUF5803 family protein [Halocalculus aciditolerans]GGL59612.1 hypothetical protein GCM10009039_17340 [Halocalculus aciditolerans]
MTSRRLLAVTALLALVALGGCVGGPGGTGAAPDNTTYDWHTNATGSDVTVNVTSDYYYAVYEVENRSTVSLSRPSELGGNTGVTVGAPAFRYENGTVTRNLTVDAQNQQTVVTLPAERGQLAYTSPSTTRSVIVPVAVNGSYDVALPPGMRAEIPVLGSVTPGGYALSIEENRAHYRWASIDDATIEVQYYLHRDAYIFAGLLVALAIIAVLGTLYLRRQVRELEQARRDAGLDP